MIARVVIVTLLVLFNGAALAQQPFKKKDLVGTWIYDKSYTVLPDGTRINQFGKEPHGYFMIQPNGRYSHIVMTRDRPHIANGSLVGGTEEDNRINAQGTLAHFGTYTVDEKGGKFTTQIEGSSFPNFEGIKQTRIIEKLDDKILRYVSQTSSSAAGAKVYAELRKATP
jgi:hypothetical protein